MKLKNMELLNAKQPLQELVKMKFPWKTSLALAKLVQKLNEVLVPVEQVKDGLVQRFGTPDKAGNVSIKPGDENWGEFFTEYGELLQQEVELVITPVVLPESLEVEPAVVMALEKFVTVA